MDEFQQTIFNPKDFLTILFGIVVSLGIAFYKVFFDMGKRRLARIGGAADGTITAVRNSFENTGFAFLSLSAFVFSISALFVISAAVQTGEAITGTILFWGIFSLGIMNLLYLFQYNPYYQVRLLDNPHLRGGVIAAHSIILTVVTFLLVRQLFNQYVLVKQFPLKHAGGLSLVQILLLFIALFLNVLVLGGQPFQRARSLWFRQLAIGLLVVFVGLCFFIPVTKPFQKGYVMKLLEQDSKQVKRYLDSLEKVTRVVGN